MNRRDMLRLSPLAAVGMAAGSESIPAAETREFQDSDRTEESFAARYLRISREMLARLHDTQSAAMMEAAYDIAAAVKRGARLWCNWNMGHNLEFDLFPDRNGEPEMFTVNYRADQAKKGDLFLVTAYGGSMEDVAKKGVFVIGGPDPYFLDGHGEEQFRDDLWNARVRPWANLWIDNGMTRVDAVIEIPGVYARLCPVSPLLGMGSFWMMIVDACRVLAREGRAVPVKGDEPKLPDTAPKSWEPNARVSLDEPLMEKYYRRLDTELSMIHAEMGKIRAVAEMVVDTVLSDGTVYCYSKFRNQLAVEGNTRRGGLALFNGIFDGGAEKEFNYINTLVGERPFTAKDCVIMGFTKPDDPVDLENLEKFRKAGMRVASIGPMTRDYKLPEGATIPKQTDVHLGRMCDTYGLFAVPGFEKKVCPTSGALVNQMFWAVCAEIAERIIERTGGDAPGVFGNVAIEGGRPLMRHMIEIYKERKY